MSNSEIVKIGRVVDLIAEPASDSTFQLGLEKIESGTGRLLDFSDATYAGTGVGFCVGDVLFGKLRPYLAKAWLADRSGAAVGDFHVYRPMSARLDSRYFTYCTLSNSFLSEVASSVYGSKMPRVSWSFVRNIEVHLPSLQVQRAIADYLDRETQRIDELIAEQRGLIETLRERRQAVMTRLVTRGLDSDADLAESGSKWLDLTPSSWKLTRFRFVATIDGGMVDPRRGDMPNEVLIAPNHIEGGTGRLLSIETAGSQGADSNKYQVREGQIIYSKIRPTLNKAVIAPRDCLCSADMYPISFDSDQVASRYALYQMLSRPIHDYVTERSMRVKMPKVNREELADLPWVLPPLVVQELISDEIDSQTSRIDALIAESEDLIALSQERRAALITAAVTGQIDVRTAA